MIRTSIGAWLNYATTYAFQIAFAQQYGSNSNAAIFIISFTVAIAASGLLYSTVQAVVVPRFLNSKGQILLKTARYLIISGLLALAITCVCILLSSPIAAWLKHFANGVPEDLQHLVQLSSLFFLLQFLAGILIAVGFARGRRFLPAASPAIPSVVATVALLVNSNLTPNELYLSLDVGVVLQILMLLVVLYPRVAVSSEEPVDVLVPTLQMGAAYLLLAVIAPLERVVAASQSPASAAQYDYAIRSLKGVQQLLIGGVVLAKFSDWSTSHLGSESVTGTSILFTLQLCTAALLFAAAIAVSSASFLVHLLFERGRFGPNDTRAVAQILLAGVAGFVFDGLASTLATSLAAVRRNGLLLAITFVTVSIRIVSMLGLGKLYGAVGVAESYSLTGVVSCVLLVALSVRFGNLAVGLIRAWVWSSLPGGVSVLLAGFLAWQQLVGPAVLRCFLVTGVFAAGSALWWRVSLPRGFGAGAHFGERVS